MRAMLVDWMVDVSVEYWLYDDTLHLAVAILDASMTSSLQVSASAALRTRLNACPLHARMG